MGLSIRARQALHREMAERLQQRLELAAADRVLCETWQAETMRPAEVCGLLGVSRRTLQRIVARGELPTIRLGDTPQSRLWFAKADVEAFLASRTGNATISKP